MLKVTGKFITVSNLDTFAIPFVIKNHVFASGEELVFTVRKLNLVKQRFGSGYELGDIVFQKRLTVADATNIPNADGDIVAFQVVFTATKEQSRLIEAGKYNYDLALIDNVKNAEVALIEPSPFNVLEVLR